MAGRMPTFMSQKQESLLNDVAITALPTKKEYGLTSSFTEREVQMYLVILALHEAGGGINFAIAKASATRIIR